MPSAAPGKEKPKTHIHSDGLYISCYYSSKVLWSYCGELSVNFTPVFKTANRMLGIIKKRNENKMESVIMPLYKSVVSI